MITVADTTNAFGHTRVVRGGDPVNSTSMRDQRQELLQARIASLERELEELKDALLVYEASKVSEESFARVWDNPEDAKYDEL